MKTPVIATSFLALCASVCAQNMGTGAYPHATFDTPGFDSINTGNLNVRFAIPIVNRPGRGLPFQYALQYEGLVWAPVTSSGVTAWVPDPNWGFSGTLNGNSFSGYLTYSSFVGSCRGSDYDSGTTDNWSGFVYHDPFGADHDLNYYVTYSEGCANGDGFNYYGDGSALDGSGHKVLSDYTIRTKNGGIIVPGQSATGTDSTSWTDSNGNKITKRSANTFTDTLGITALSITGSAPVSMTYPVALQANSATTASATVSYHTYTVRTNFQCSGIVDYGSNTVSLIDTVTLADGSPYHFVYEGTPGANDGAVTARLKSVMLPTGGSVNYSYSGGCNGSGLNSDGTVATLTRQTTDGTRSYTRSTINSNATSTTLQDEKGNQTLYNFTITGTSPALAFETHREVFQGSTSGPNLLDQYTCYNGASANCDGQSITTPITEVDVLTSYNNGPQALTKNLYDSTGVTLGSTSQYQGSTLLASTGLSYNSLGEVLSSSTTDGSGNTVASSTFNYDEMTPTATSNIPQHVSVSGPRGNQTSSHISIGSSTLDTSTTCWDTGAPISATAQDGGSTSYGYDSTQTFATQTSLPAPPSGVSLATSATYDLNSAALTSSTGMNSGQTTTIQQYDALMRPLTVTYPLSGASTTLGRIYI